MSTDTIRVGVVGAGNNTRNRHIPGLQAIPGVEVVAVCNRSRESSQQVVDEFNLERVEESWEDIVTAEDLDAVVIGTWPYMHCLVGCQALFGGKHVMTEARMAMNADEAYEMRDAARNNPDLVAQVVPSPFTLAYDAYIQELIANGYLGELLAINVVQRGGGFLNPTAPLTWRQDFAYSGFNTLALGIFYEALARWVGHADGVSAMGKVSQRMRPDADGVMRAVRIPDHLNVMASMECGAIANLQFSTVTGADPAGYFTLYGSEGTLHLDVKQGLSGARKGEDALQPLEVPAEKQGRWRVEEEFVGAIRGEEPIVLTTFEEGVRYMEFTEAVARSVLEGGTIALPL